MYNEYIQIETQPDEWEEYTGTLVTSLPYPDRRVIVLSSFSDLPYAGQTVNLRIAFTLVPNFSDSRAPMFLYINVPLKSVCSQAEFTDL